MVHGCCQQPQINQIQPGTAARLHPGYGAAPLVPTKSDLSNLSIHLGPSKMSVLPVSYGRTCGNHAYATKRHMDMGDCWAKRITAACHRTKTESMSNLPIILPGDILSSFLKKIWFITPGHFQELGESPATNHSAFRREIMAITQNNGVQSLWLLPGTTIPGS